MSSTLNLAARRRKSRYIKKFKVFYHIAAMNNWKEVIIEQKELLDSLSLEPICGVLGEHDDVKWLEQSGLNIQYHSKNLQEYETPTLELLYDWSLKNEDGAVLYMHTKGVSNPNDINKKYWRWLMSDYVIKDYENNLLTLEVADMVGVNWIDSPNHPHYSGNFWMSRADWICNLKSPSQHKIDGGPVIWGNPWERMHAEMWLGSTFYHLVESLCCRNEMLTGDNRLYNRYKQ